MAARSRKVFINLCVKDLPRTKDFFAKLGFGYDPRFTNDDAACMPLSEDGFVMFLTEAHFKNFTKRQICDTSTHTEALFAFSCESREEVDRMVKTAVENGGRPAMDAQDHGFMYAWSFYDPEGHHWEVMYWDEEKAQQMFGG